MMLLAADIGNSTVVIALFSDLRKNTPRVIDTIPAAAIKSALQYRKIIRELVAQSQRQDQSSAIDVIIASVVPAATTTIIRALEGITPAKPLIVSNKFCAGLRFAVKKQSSVGADRIASAVAAWTRIKKPVAVADFGTATTLTVVGPEMTLLGGSIMPGLGLMEKTLRSETALLPAVPLAPPRVALGNDTRSSIASGIIRGTAGAVEKLMKDIEKELCFDVQLMLTGGYARIISPLISRTHVVIPRLVIDGLRLIYMHYTHP